MANAARDQNRTTTLLDPAQSIYPLGPQTFTVDLKKVKTLNFSKRGKSGWS